MLDLSALDLLDSERKVAEWVQSIGLIRASNALIRLGDRLNRRAEKWNDERTYIDFVFTADYVARDWEKDLLYRLKLGLSILDDKNTPYAARQRILKRIEERKRRAAIKRAQHTT